MRSSDRNTLYGSEDTRQTSPSKPIKATVPMNEVMQTINTDAMK